MARKQYESLAEVKRDGYSVVEIAREAGINEITARKAVNKEPISEPTYDKLHAAFGIPRTAVKLSTHPGITSTKQRQAARSTQAHEEPKNPTNGFEAPTKAASTALAKVDTDVQFMNYADMTLRSFDEKTLKRTIGWLVDKYGDA